MDIREHRNLIIDEHSSKLLNFISLDKFELSYCDKLFIVFGVGVLFEFLDFLLEGESVNVRNLLQC